MGSKEWAIILAAIITAAATIFSGMLSNSNNPSSISDNPSSINKSIDNKINLLPTISGLTSYEPDPQYAGAIIHWTSAAYDPENDLLRYKYVLNGKDATDWTTDKNWAWETSSNNIGDNQIDVWIRDGKHTDSNNFDDHASAKFTIMEQSPASISETQIQEEAAVSSPPKHQKFYLSDLGAYRTENFCSVKYNEFAKMKIGNIMYDKGVKIHAFYGDDYYYAYFNLNGEYSRLSGLVGLDDNNNFDDDVTVTFIGDDVVELQTVKLHLGDFPVEVNIDVSGVRKLTIRGTKAEWAQNLDLIDMELTK